MEHNNFGNVWKLFCGVCTLLAIFFTLPISFGWVFLYLGVGGGSGFLIFESIVHLVKQSGQRGK